MALVVVAIAVAFVRKPLMRRLAPAPTVPTYEVHRVPFARHVAAEGNLRAVKAEPVSAPMTDDGPPMKIAWLALDGSQVKQGEVVARFDPTEFRKRLLEGEVGPRDGRGEDRQGANRHGRPAARP